MLYVAYNARGDLIADSYSYDGLLAAIGAMGYRSHEVFIGMVTP